MEALKILYREVPNKFFDFWHGKLCEFVVYDLWKWFSLYGAVFFL